MTLEQRVDQLEQRVNRYRMALAVVVVAVCAVVTMAATAEKNGNFDVLTARSIYVTNDDGEFVVGLGASDGGDGLVQTFGANGKELVRLTATMDDNGAVATFGANGKELVQLSSTTNGAIVAVYNKTGEDIVNLFADEYGNGAVSVHNKTGEDVVQLCADEYGNGVVGAYNRKGKGRTLESQ